MNFEERIRKIETYKERMDAEKAKAEEEEARERERLIEEVRSLRPRIEALIATANCCVANGIEINRYGQSHEIHLDSWKLGTFVSNNKSHRVGFYGGNPPISAMGIVGTGGMDFFTDGIRAVGIDCHCDTCKPLMEHLRGFVDNFPAFETAFYEYVDKIVEAR